MSFRDSIATTGVAEASSMTERPAWFDDSNEQVVNGGSLSFVDGALRQDINGTSNADRCNFSGIPSLGTAERPVVVAEMEWDPQQAISNIYQAFRIRSANPTNAGIKDVTWDASDDGSIEFYVRNPSNNTLQTAGPTRQWVDEQKRRTLRIELDIAEDFAAWYDDGALVSFIDLPDGTVSPTGDFFARWEASDFNNADCTIDYHHLAQYDGARNPTW